MNEDELMRNLSSAFHQYATDIANGRGISIYHPMLDGESVTVTITLKPDNTLKVVPLEIMPMVETTDFDIVNLEPEPASEPETEVKPKPRRKKTT